MLTTHLQADYSGPDEYLSDIRKAKENLSIPLLASLNAVNHDTWIKYAGLLSETGEDLDLSHSGDYKKSLRFSGLLFETIAGKQYNSIDEFRGKLSKKRLCSNPFIYKRAQCADLHINSEQIFGVQQ